MKWFSIACLIITLIVVIFVCYFSFSGGEGIRAVCKDGTISQSKNRNGTCSGHGGVAAWTKD